MPKIVKALDERGRVFRVSEEEAKTRNLTVLGDVAEETSVPAADAKNKKRTTFTRRRKS